MKPTLVPLTALLVVTLCSVAQAGVVFPDMPAAPEEAATVDPNPLRLVSQTVDVEIIDQVATTTVSHVFKNDRGYPVAGTFVLPLGETASVQQYAFWSGGRRFVSVVQAREEAQQTFEAAKARGENAALLAYKDDSSFSARFTELAPGETRRFEVIYSELLPYEAGLVRYSHPLDYDQLGLAAPDELQVRVRVADSKPIAALRVPSHPQAQRKGDEAGRETLLRLDGQVPDRDFEIEYKLESKDFGLAFRTFKQDGDEGFFVAMVAPREEASDEEIVRKDVAFVFDVSGSMSGTKIDQARSALKACLNLMNPGDGLYLLAFSDSMNPWQTARRELTEQVRVEASAFADGLHATGGTHIQDAVLTALDALQDSERPTALVFLTDGLGTRPVDETLAAIEAANPQDRTRIFTFGVGSDVNQSFLERLGTENRGDYIAIRGDTRIDEAVGTFYASIARPVLTDLAFDFGDVTPNRSYPARLPDVYQGQRLVVTGRYRGTGAHAVTVTGRIGGQERTLQIPVDFAADQTEHPWVARLWGKRRAEFLLAEIRMYGETPEAKAEVIALSSAYGFATPYTSLVAREDTRVASLTPARVKPGDPVLAIPAPPDSVSVTAFLPFGEVKELMLDPMSRLWTARFLVPRSARDGVYWIHVVATAADGSTTWFRISYTVDTTAPVMQLKVGPADVHRPGAVVQFEARPVVGFLELGQDMVRALGRDAAARAKAFVDIRSVVARLPELGLETGLQSEGGTKPGFRGELALPYDVAPGDYRVEVTATDVAGNKHTTVERVLVGPALVTEVY